MASKAKGVSQIGLLGGKIARDETEKATTDYEDYFKTEDDSKRKGNYTDVVNKYYDLATSFYEFGWGESFHFAHRYKWETLRESIVRHEHYLASKLQVKKGDSVLDVGCGVGGPLREIAAFTGASVTGLNNNAFQISRGEVMNKRTGRHDNCGFIKADFMNIPKPDNSYDGVYQIEATCHAPDAVGCYSEIFRVLKPGGIFASYEWCLTDDYDENNPEHRAIRQDILLGNGLPTARTTHEVLAALKEAGFEILEEEDLVKTADIPWYEPIDPYRRWSPFRDFWSFKTTSWGRNITHYFVLGLEKLGIAPKGSVNVSGFLKKGADALVAGGKTNTYTVMYLTVARKPLTPLKKQGSRMKSMRK
jgi:sterol 24-C-methyltransferase